MLRIGAMRPNPAWLLTNPSRLTPLSNLSPNTDLGRFSVVASEACQTSSRQLNFNDAFGTLALVRDDQGPIRRPCVERPKVSHGLCDQRDAGFDFNIHVIGAAAKAYSHHPDRHWSVSVDHRWVSFRSLVLLQGGHLRRRGNPVAVELKIELGDGVGRALTQHRSYGQRHCQLWRAPTVDR